MLPIDNNISLAVKSYPHHLIRRDYELRVPVETLASNCKCYVAHNLSKGRGRGLRSILCGTLGVQYILSYTHDA